MIYTKVNDPDQSTGYELSGLLRIILRRLPRVLKEGISVASSSIYENYESTGEQIEHFELEDLTNPDPAVMMKLEQDANAENLRELIQIELDALSAILLSLSCTIFFNSSFVASLFSSSCITFPLVSIISLFSSNSLQHVTEVTAVCDDCSVTLFSLGSLYFLSNAVSIQRQDICNSL